MSAIDDRVADDGAAEAIGTAASAGIASAGAASSSASATSAPSIIRVNTARAKLEAGEPILGMGVQQVVSSAAAGLALRCGFDFLFIDCEHSPVDAAAAANIAAAALPLGISPLVRVPGKGSHDIARLLDSGAQGIIVPHVDDAAEAALAVRASKYPPLGMRSFFALQPHFDYVRQPAEQAMAIANGQILTIVMLESPGAIANAHAIAAVPGVDVLMIGCNDLSLELGIPGQVGDERIAAAVHTVVAACAAHGKHPGLGGVADAVLLKRYIDAGMRFVLCTNDTDLLIAAGEARVQSLR
ncbi:MAG: hpcH/HpaI aldolase/citrate lyase family protein [Rhizobacter sp.]|nr:hpcH/HpaI aldolase/citrate lyase family protein [Rhizobacter sp.]